MRVFKTSEFSRDARKEKVTDAALLRAVERTVAGKIDADLGAHLIKQRVSQGKGGRTGSHRAVIVYKIGERIVFVHLFGKRVKANLKPRELEIYRKVAKAYSDLDPEHIEDLLRINEWIEIDYGKEQEGL